MNFTDTITLIFWKMASKDF